MQGSDKKSVKTPSIIVGGGGEKRSLGEGLSAYH